MEEKKIVLKILISLAIALLISAGVFSGLWLTARNELLDNLALSRIGGNAYIDYGVIGAYDGFEPPVTGLVIQLYQAGKELPVQETEVDKAGKYEFAVVEPGVYRVQPMYNIPGYPGWDYITILRYPDDILVEEGEHYDGPIFLVRKDGGPKG